MKEIFKKIIFIFPFLLLSICLSSCTTFAECNSYCKDTIQELEERIDTLESEKAELEEKLENIQSMAESRDYNYSEILDDIEDESSY